MTGSAWDAYARVRDGFRAPPDARRWRRDVVVASGLSALAAEAVLRDVHRADGAAPVVVRDAEAVAGIARGDDGAGVLGCSFSGTSAEVVDAMVRLRAAGVPCALHGAGPACDPALRFAAELAAPPFRHAAFCATLPVLLGGAAADARPASAREPYADFLARAADAGAFGVFVGAGDGFRARVLSSYWIEYLRRPGFGLHFPELTHDVIWALALSGAQPFAFVLERPETDLSDRRFARLEALLRAMDVPLLVLEAPPPRRGEHVPFVLDAADELARVAHALGAPIGVELTFENVLQASSV